jgi:hypothetical protein
MLIPIVRDISFLSGVLIFIFTVENKHVFGSSDLRCIHELTSGVEEVHELHGIVYWS